LRLATRDRLTGLWNRRAIFERLSEALSDVHALNPEISVVLADVDGLKKINDRFGHRVGDAVLREIARRFCFCVRRSDELGRFGGEEFLIVLLGCGTQAAAIRVAEFRAAIENEYIMVEGKQLSVSCSFGVHTVIRAGTDCDGAARDVETALRRAKQTGPSSPANIKAG
jgi:diguanylate cyclase (GGDEF)-like protein